MIPEGWKIEHGENIASKITKGQSPKWQGFEYQDSGTLFVTSENVRDGRLDISKPKYLSIEFNEKLKGSQLKKGDILINIVGASIGRSCQFNLDIQHANINQAVCLFRTKDNVDKHYVIQFLQLPNTICQLLGTQSESARPNLSLGDIREFKFLLPPLLEQQKIAEILSTWDKAIELLEQLIAMKRKLKQGLMQQLLTGKRRFKEFEGSEWKVAPLKNIGKVISGGTPDTSNSDYWDGEIPWCTPSEITILDNRYIHNTERKLSDKGLKSSSTILLPAHSLIVCTRATVGNCAINTIPMCTNQGFKSLVPRQGICIEYLYYKMSSLTHLLLRLANGSTFLEVSKKDFESVEIELPSLDEQEKIASVLSAADTEIETLEKQLSAYKQQKRGLMQQLLTGKKRVASPPSTVFDSGRPLSNYVERGENLA
jgi:type I restriction enzyme, S subunit